MIQDITNHLWGFALKRHVDQMGNGRFYFYKGCTASMLQWRAALPLATQL